ncbi:hypothetical protein QA648_10850 [Rhizobium sp. CB3171]|uniref:hypothetical protein n=1 Tax=Rhizobium sp. CB3171 TaxID=3039157 RepID=UPI0024B095DD|nr:hypothetical protein [Rhizobium sp. CB3171]WFU00670.1 hypothetical protein QA648_10850 [Rhizobium sp. CB3171]
MAERREAAREVVRALEDGVDPNRLGRLRMAAATMAEFFYMVGEEAKNDWFLMSAMLAHPTSRDAYTAGRRFREMGAALEKCDIDLANTLLRASRKKDVAARLEHFLASSRPENPIELPNDAKWLYLFRCEQEWGVVNLCTIEGPLEDALSEMDEINPELAPYGISAAWQVHDTAAAYALAANTLQRAFIQTDFYDFRDLYALRDMKKAISAVLQDYDLLVTGLPFASVSWPSIRRPVRTSHEIRPEAVVSDETEEDVVNEPGGIAP